MITDELVPGHVEQHVGVRGMPVDLLDVGRSDVEDANEPIRVAVVKLMADTDVVEDETRLVGVPGRDRRIQGHDGRVGAHGGHGGDATERGPELGIDHGLREGRLGQGCHRAGNLVLHQPLAEVGGAGAGRRRGGERAKHGQDTETRRPFHRQHLPATQGSARDGAEQAADSELSARLGAPPPVRDQPLRHAAHAPWWGRQAASIGRPPERRSPADVKSKLSEKPPRCGVSQRCQASHGIHQGILISGPGRS